MLQEYPTQIQPRSSAARRESDAFELPVPSSIKMESDKGDAEVAASRILIDLANQDTSEAITEPKTKRRASSFGSKGGGSLPIKTDTNLHLHQERSQPDPIMLLAAAAAVIDNDSYKKRSYERREIRLYGRHYAKRKSFTYGSTTIQECHNEPIIRHYRNQQEEEKKKKKKRHSSMQIDPPHWTRLSEEETEESSEEDMKKRANGYYKEQTASTTPQSAFSWQYLSMKHNPRIKRNAMHAYITYMIYTDRQNKDESRLPHHHHQHQHQHHHHHQLTTTTTKQEENMDWYPPPPSNKYNLPSPPSRQQPPPSADTIGNSRPLTDFLFNHSSSVLPPPPPPSFQ